jgi:ABC-type sulfate transport system permease component
MFGAKTMSVMRAARPRGLVLALVVLVLLVFVVWVLFALLFMPYPLWPWEWAYWSGREVIRTIWATLTGQSTHVDLFPG